MGAACCEDLEPCECRRLAPSSCMLIPGHPSVLQPRRLCQSPSHTRGSSSPRHPWPHRPHTSSHLSEGRGAVPLCSSCFPVFVVSGGFHVGTGVCLSPAQGRRQSTPGLLSRWFLARSGPASQGCLQCPGTRWLWHLGVGEGGCVSSGQQWVLLDTPGPGQCSFPGEEQAARCSC